MRDYVSEWYDVCGMVGGVLYVSFVPVCHRELELFVPEVSPYRTLPAKSAGCHPAHLRQCAGVHGRYKLGVWIFECGLRERALCDGSFANGKKGGF